MISDDFHFKITCTPNQLAKTRRIILEALSLMSPLPISPYEIPAPMTKDKPIDKIIAINPTARLSF
jgi:hypothetical protein